MVGNFLKYLFLSLLSFSVQSQNSHYPNILFISVDDLKPTIGSFGDSLAQTPHLDKISENGAVFLNNHSQQAICGPSRASLLTGKRPDYTLVRDLKTKMREMVPNIVTIPQYFKDQGYHTVGIGKIFDPRCVDKLRDEPSWSEPFIPEHKLDYPDNFGAPALGFYQNLEVKEKIKKLRLEAKTKGVNNLGAYVRERYKPPISTSEAPDEAYVDGALAVQAIKYLEDFKEKATEKPFFLAVGFKRPHLPFAMPKEYWDLYNSSDFDIASFQENSMNGPSIAYHSSGELRSYITPDISYETSTNNKVILTENFQKDLIHGYYASTSFVDAQIGKIIDKLKSTGLSNNTIVVVWGDHGWHLGDHGLWNKHSNFEQATRSPLIIFDPRIEKKITITSPTEFIDLFPTLCDAAGLQIPDNLDGVSLMSMVRGNQISVKPFAVSQYTNSNKTGYSFRTDRYRYTVWIQGKKSTDPIFESDIYAEELYDYLTDPNETKNISNDENTTKIVLRFQKLAANFFNKQSDVPFKEILRPKNEFKFGATLNYHELGSNKESLFLKDFNFLTPANSAKQSRVHPSPGLWQWDRINEFIKFANENNLTLRIHGPVSPQASKWAKEDHRTANELEKVMTDFMIQSSKLYNEEKNIKYMDVVNETVLPNGNWFGPKKGTNLWENPWLKMGFDENGYPNYIVKAFEIATQHAPNVKLVYNQNGGMQPAMWKKIKNTITYLRSRGLRVDGIGWQGHLNLSRSTNDFIEKSEKALIELSNLIDWAHANNLDFHVTELDYRVSDMSNLKKELQIQAELYQKIVNVLQSKINSGTVTLNLWDMGERLKKPSIYFQSIYDRNLDPTPAYNIIKKAITRNK